MGLKKLCFLDKAENFLTFCLLLHWVWTLPSVLGGAQRRNQSINSTVWVHSLWFLSSTSDHVSFDERFSWDLEQRHGASVTRMSPLWSPPAFSLFSSFIHVSPPASFRFQRLEIILQHINAEAKRRTSTCEDSVYDLLQGRIALTRIISEFMTPH